MTNQNILKATKFWLEVDKKFPGTPRIMEWTTLVAEGEADYFRNFDLVFVAIEKHCRIGRIGFDQDKFDNSVKWANELKKSLGVLIDVA